MSPGVRTIRLFSPLAVTLLCIAAQGHYITPLVQQATMDYLAVGDAEVSQVSSQPVAASIGAIQ